MTVIMLKEASRGANIKTSLLPFFSHARNSSTIPKMKRLTIDSKYRMLSGHEIPVLGFGVKDFCFFVILIMLRFWIKIQRR